MHRPQPRPNPFDSLLTGGILEIHGVGGSVQLLDPARWRAGTDGTDADVLQRCTGPTLDLGCGPGRLVRALRGRGVVAWGVDSSAVAVTMCRRRGIPVLQRDVFDPLPGQGSWRHVLLLDGNIGIGGDPDRLLARAATLTAAGGSVLVETDPDPEVSWAGSLPFPDPAGSSPTRWARTGARALDDHAARRGLTVRTRWAARPGRGEVVELVDAGVTTPVVDVVAEAFRGGSRSRRRPGTRAAYGT